MLDLLISSFLQQKAAQEVLVKLQGHPDAWQRVDLILEFSTNQETKVSKNNRRSIIRDFLCLEFRTVILFILKQNPFVYYSYRKVIFISIFLLNKTQT